MNARQCLFIYNNIEHITLRYSSLSIIEATYLANFLPQFKLYSVIFTTTNHNIAKALASQGVIALRELTLDLALKMLEIRLA